MPRRINNLARTLLGLINREKDMKMNPLFSAIGLATAVFAAPVLAEVKWDMANEYQESSIHGQAQKVFTDTAMEASADTQPARANKNAWPCRRAWGS
jgi:hypothetical protein